MIYLQCIHIICIIKSKSRTFINEWRCFCMETKRWIIAHVNSSCCSMGRISVIPRPAKTPTVTTVVYGNTYWHECSDSCAYDKNCKVKNAVRISSNGRKWSPWATYNDGLHKRWMNDASMW